MFGFMKFWVLNPGIPECLVRFNPLSHIPSPRKGLLICPLQTRRVSLTHCCGLHPFCVVPLSAFTGKSLLPGMASMELASWSCCSCTFLQLELLPSHSFKLCLVRNSGLGTNRGILPFVFPLHDVTVESWKPWSSAVKSLSGSVLSLSLRGFINVCG